MVVLRSSAERLSREQPNDSTQKYEAGGIPPKARPAALTGRCRPGMIAYWVDQPPASERPVSPPRSHQPAATRRDFLKSAGAMIAIAPLAALARASECRSLSFVHTHTGESLSCVYYQAGGYDAATLARVNHFLRDFRTGAVHPIDAGVLDILFAVRSRADRDDPFHVISGYRSPTTNAYLRSHSPGVARHSLHMEGRAIDVRLPGLPTRKLRDIGLALRRGGVGYYPASDFVHLDTGHVRFW